MHSDLQQLLQLDEVERELARLRAEIAGLPRRVGEIESRLASIHAEVEAGRKALKELETARRKREGDIQALQQKISRYRDQMLAVKTNQEYRALGNEIQFAEREIRLIEDRILEGMLEAEAREKQLKQAEAEQTKQQAAAEQEKQQARARTDQDQRRLGELIPRREALRQAITPDLVRHYDRVLKLRGSALAEAREQYCQACHVMLRPQVYNDVMTGEQVLTCESCYRLLYFNPANAAGVAPESGEIKESLETAAAPGGEQS